MDEQKQKTECCLNPERIFVFGSNLSGIHGGGAARHAMDYHGAEFGVGVGRTGNSYALPTVAANIGQSLPLEIVKEYVEQFLGYARCGHNKHLEFLVTRVGCGIAGFKDEEIAPLFNGAPRNCIMPEEWKGMFTPGVE